MLLVRAADLGNADAGARHTTGRRHGIDRGAYRSVLVLGAESAALALLERSLKDCEVIPVRDARHLPEMVLTHHPKMIIHDIRADAELIWQDVADLGVPVVECALPRDANVGGAKELGVQAYLTKPITAQTLIDEIDRVGRRARRADRFRGSRVRAADRADAANQRSRFCGAPRLRLRAGARRDCRAPARSRARWTR